MTVRTSAEVMRCWRNGNQGLIPTAFLCVSGVVFTRERFPRATPCMLFHDVAEVLQSHIHNLTLTDFHLPATQTSNEIICGIQWTAAVRQADEH